HRSEEILHNIAVALSQKQPDDILIDLLEDLVRAMGLRAIILPAQPDVREIPENAPELYRRRNDRSENPPGFIRRVYGPWLGAGMIRADLLKLDRPLYQALQNWLRTNDMPDWLDLPTL